MPSTSSTPASSPGRLSALWGDRGVTTKIIGAVGVAALVAVGVGTSGLSSAGTAQDAATELYESNLSRSELVADIDGNLTRVDINILRMLAIGDPQSIAGWKAENEDRFATVDELLDELSAATAGTDEQEAVDGLVVSYDAMRAGMQAQVAEIEAGDMAGAAAVNATQVKDNADAVFTELSTLAEDNAADGAEQIAATQAGGDSARTTILLELVLGVALAVTIGWLVARGIARGLRRVQDVTEALAAGDLTRTVGLTTDDELGRTGRALDAATTSLRTVMSSVVASAEAVAASSEQLSASSARISASAGETAAQSGVVSAAAEEVSRNVGTVSAGAEEMGASIREISQNANEAARVAATAVSEAATTNATVLKLGALPDGVAAAQQRRPLHLLMTRGRSRAWPAPPPRRAGQDPGRADHRGVARRAGRPDRPAAGPAAARLRRPNLARGRREATAATSNKPATPALHGGTIMLRTWPARPVPILAGQEIAWALTGPASLARHRTALRRHLVELGDRVDELAGEQLVMAVDELATNALLHGTAPAHARAVVGADCWLVVVTDAARELPPRPAVGRDPAQGGMGLHLVASFAMQHGWSSGATGKDVWALLPHREQLPLVPRR
ncbi:HAMP domain-containing protein [Modestobacter sp. I12A-02628]|uniref:HAMP domain-containing protein n=1 Tax=Goekera deserti TaxID=2497753 RepID=A0A7K3WED7_9ACTN|nr:MCP four helix bundle domain-containing protein [Goekera deserti]MPQ99715.1 HAMP domain-containing protein [Goekera deserti]NDI46274.1 HAMP domain-containing protein [Goekera deserti]NEL54794.1 HAMP domain-containing protein [Goekera deserti]